MKRIVICVDGTWGTPEVRFPSNVVLAARSILPRTAGGTDQVVFYDWGIGTDDGRKFFGGATGKGIDKNICDAYRFLVYNYTPGDEIYLFGFSRGAYTVRSLAGFLNKFGILPKYLAHKIPQHYEMYRKSGQWPDRSQPEVIPPKIKFLGVWDTVGSLGIPLLTSWRYRFHDTWLNENIENAFHALAADEDRRTFQPSLWTVLPGRKNTEQRWFKGRHSDVGGGSGELPLSTHTLFWLLKKAADCGLEMSIPYPKSEKETDNAKITENTSLLSIAYSLFKKKRRRLCTSEDETEDGNLR